MDLLLELLLRLLLKLLLVLLLLLLLYVLYHVHTRVPSCNARKRMKHQEGTASRNHWEETFEQIVLKDVSWTSDLKAAPTRNIRTERMREDEPSLRNIANKRGTFE